MNPDDLEAGPALDALISKHVFGATTYPHDVRYGTSPCERCNKFVGDAKDPPTCPVPPYYSYEMSEAWKVVERLEEKLSLEATIARTTFGIADEGASNYGTNYDWTCRLFAPLGDGSWGREAHGVTAPLAICRAALKAVAAAAHPAGDVEKGTEATQP